MMLSKLRAEHCSLDAGCCAAELDKTGLLIRNTQIEGISQFCLEHDIDRNILSRLLRNKCH
jgi:hypothetical protein